MRRELKKTPVRGMCTASARPTLTLSARDSGCTNQQFASDDEIFGPLHSNDSLWTCDGSTFGRPGRNDKLEVTGGSVTMNENETFSGVTVLRETVEGVVDDYSASCTGTYTRSGSTVAFAEAESDDCGGNYSGTWTSGNTLTVTFAPRIVAVFKK